jgi:hypothetical protein
VAEEPSDVIGPNGEDDGQASGRRIPVWFTLIVMVVALIGAALILSRVAGPLYGMLFSIDPPVPKGVHKLEHTKEKAGESWLYRTTMTGREVAAFYEDEGGDCRYSPLPDNPELLPGGVSYKIAECSGHKDHFGSGITWEVIISEGYSETDGPTVFRLFKFEDVK